MALNPRAKEAAEKVVYEVQMFRWIAETLIAEPKETTDSERPNPWGNLLLEGLLLHTRTLQEFLMSRPYKDDILATGFLDDGTAWDTATLCPYVNSNLERMNKKLQHLTYARLDMAEEWDVVAVRNDILNGWTAFLKALPQERRAWFE